jgi:hypothetical protein
MIAHWKRIQNIPPSLSVCSLSFSK